MWRLFSETIDFPLCKVCGKSVDNMTSSGDPVRRGIHFKIYCHGEEEELFLSSFAIINGSPIRLGPAFDTP